MKPDNNHQPHDQAWLETIKELVKEEDLLLKLQTTDDQNYLADLEITITNLTTQKFSTACQ